MEHYPVESNNIASVGYDPATFRMQVLFKRGGLYEYSQVEEAEFEAVRKPSDEFEFSVYKAFEALIKRRKNYHRIITSDPAPRIEEAEPAAEAEPEAQPLPDEVKAVNKQSTELMLRAAVVHVTDPLSQAEASDVLLAIAAMRSQIQTTFKPMKQAAYNAHRVICDQESQLDTPLANAEKEIKLKIGNFVQEQRRLAQEAEAQLRKKQLAEAESEAARRRDDLAINQAIDLEARGDHKAAEAVLNSPAPVPLHYVPPAPVVPQVARVQGVTVKEDWDFRVVDLSLVPREYLVLNETAIRNVGKNTKGKARIPGVEFFPKPVTSARRSR